MSYILSERNETIKIILKDKLILDFYADISYEYIQGYND